jgi:hypothetical protein
LLIKSQDYFLVVENPPDAMRGQFLKFSEEEAKLWLDGELAGDFRKSTHLLRRNSVLYKDVTFETLNRRDFLEAVKNVFPRIDWEKPIKPVKSSELQVRKTTSRDRLGRCRLVRLTVTYM